MLKKMSGKFKMLFLSFLIWTAIVIIIYVVSPSIYQPCEKGYQKSLYLFLYNTLTYVGIILVFLIFTFLLLVLSSHNKHLPRPLFTLLFVGFFCIFLYLLMILWTTSGLKTDSHRDIRRTADLAQLRLALEMDFDEHSLYASGLDELVDDYMPRVPTDPVTRQAYDYRTDSARQAYVLRAFLEDYKPSNACYNKLESSVKHLFKEDIDGQILGLDCDDPYYCVGP